MSRTFACARVSTAGQEPGNRIMEIRAAGFSGGPHRIVPETVSGSAAVALRKGFSRLPGRMEKGDVPIVTRLDRLGRDAINASRTVSSLEEAGIRVHRLALGGVDLTGSAGKMTMNVINAVARFECGLLVERTRSGIAGARAAGKLPGRPSALSAGQQELVRERIRNGETVPSVARQFGTGRQTIMRARDQA